MFGIIVSALNLILGYIFRAVVVKFLVFTAVFLLVSAALPYLIQLLPNSATLDGIFSGFPSGVSYFLQVFAFPAGFKLILSA